MFGCVNRTTEFSKDGVNRQERRQAIIRNKIRTLPDMKMIIGRATEESKLSRYPDSQVCI